MFNFRPIELDPMHPKRHLRTLQTPFGPRTVYDSVSFCSRCGSCQQACPIYCLSADEKLSPRGRNQALRLAAEEKLNWTQNTEEIKRMMNSCLLCGRCNQACAGKIPTSEHVLEMRRALHKRVLPGLLQSLLSCRSRRPGLFRFIVRSGLVLRKLGGVKLLRASGLTRLPFLSWINHADDILPAQTPRLEKILMRAGIPLQPDNPHLIYLPSFEAEFFIPQIALSTLKLAQQKGPAAIWTHVSSGLFEYVYGDLRQSRRQVKKLIARREQTDRNLPILTDSIDVYNFLHGAPQLFERWPRWQKRAQQLADCVLYITDILPQKISLPDELRLPVRLDSSALFTREGDAFRTAEKTLKTLFKKNFVECLYKDAGVPAFGYGFVRYNKAQEVCFQAVQTIARTQTGTVFTLSGLSALELDFYLKKFYPNAKADHFVHVNG